MKTTVSFLRAILFVLLLLGSGFLITGCKSAPKVDWDSCVGSFTYDQAVTELGPPDKTATLSDGKKVADWIQRRRGSGLSFGVGTGFSTGGVGVGVGQSVGTRARDRVLRLTFGTDNRLVSWSKNY
ncbi:MAG TPA: hypothetical protein VK327_15280 [Candidatus Paceibacterota bacterium]|nr:hypothetical protein [Candidatus Paceibacterota bacterium]